jgi:hypothetical protein
VRRPSRESGFLTRRLRASDTFPHPAAKPQLLAAAQDLHRILWGNALDGILQSLGDEGGLKYLPAAEVKRLQLRCFDYGEDVLLFRQEYNTAYESLHLGSPASGEPNVVVIGQRGIGAWHCVLVSSNHVT